MKKADFIIIAVVLALAGVILLANYVRVTLYAGNAPAVEMYVDGELYKKVYITNKERTIEVDTEYGKNTVKVHDGGVEIVEADCPDELCKGFGFKTEPGDQIVCLPHHLYIEIR